MAKPTQDGGNQQRESGPSGASDRLTERETKFDDEGGGQSQGQQPPSEELPSRPGHPMDRDDGSRHRNESSKPDRYGTTRAHRYGSD
jgi:hypothetical protein